MSLSEKWQQYKPLMVKIGITILALPLLILGGFVLFSVLGFVFTLIIGLIVTLLVIAILLAVWGYTDLKFGRFGEFSFTREYSTKKDDETITITAKDVSNKDNNDD